MAKSNSKSTNNGTTNDVTIQEPLDKETMSMSACLNRIMLGIKNKSYSKSLVEEMKDDFDYVGNKFSICPEESAILACVLENSCGYSSCDEEDMAEFIGCTNIEFIGFHKHLNSLARKRIVRISKGRIGSRSYSVLKEASEAIINDIEYSGTNFSGITTEEMFTHMGHMFKSFKDDEINHDILLSDLWMLVDANPQNIFSQKIVDNKLRKLSQNEQRVFFYLCHRFVIYGDLSVDFRYINDFISERDETQRFLRQFQSGKLMTQIRKLVTFGGSDGFLDKTQVALTDRVKEEFFTEVDLLDEGSMDGNKDIMSCDSIATKELFYNDTEQEQVNRLEQLLDEKYFKGIQERLEEMGMRKGFNIILYGGPGTGKTETTLQLAKKTGRDIFYIDMSKLRSKWVGESEKSVKGIFTTYKNLCKNKALKPILFFNEADAIFGKRLENIESSAAQMLNTLQNIILQEMETLEGIMICTTNLQCNLDPAFERRFIYKIELEKPGEKVREKIWKSMLKGLDDKNYTILAEKYLFSGGQIENVARKSTVEYILSGNKTTLETVSKFCDEETFSSKSGRNRIGF